MGEVNLSNITGVQVAIHDFTVNGKDIAEQGTVIEPGETLKHHYDEKSWDDYESMNLDIILDDHLYHLNLNRSHFFGGYDFQYPGNGSDVNFVLLGVEKDRKKITMMEVYRQEGAEIYIHSRDQKTLDIKKPW